MTSIWKIIVISKNINTTSPCKNIYLFRIDKNISSLINLKMVDNSKNQVNQTINKFYLYVGIYPSAQGDVI